MRTRIRAITSGHDKRLVGILALHIKISLAILHRTMRKIRVLLKPPMAWHPLSSYAASALIDLGVESEHPNQNSTQGNLTIHGWPPYGYNSRDVLTGIVVALPSQLPACVPTIRLRPRD